MERGHHCDYSSNLKKSDIEPLIVEIIKELVQDESFASEIKRRIGIKIDTTKLEQEIANYENKLREVELNKAHLEREIDTLPIDVAHRERKLHDMNLRLDGLYDIIVEIEEKIEDAKLRKKSVEAETLTMENIYKILQRFGDLYDLITEEERKQLISHLIQEIQIYPEGESECPLKSIKFNFPVYKDGKEVREVFLKSEHNVETMKRAIERSKLDKDTNIELVQTMWEQFCNLGIYEKNVVDTTKFSISDTVLVVKEKITNKDCLLHK